MASTIPENRASFSLSEILVATGGQLVGPVSAGRREGCVGVSTDSRHVAPGNAFIALRGEKFDGHAHVAKAIERGASVVIVETDVEGPPDVSVVRVLDTTRALGALGRAHRRRWERSDANVRRAVVAITGSAGKTTTRGAIASLLRALGHRVHASSGNLNNQIGVPMTLLGLGPEHEVAVVEIGTNSRGEIAYGAGLAEPNVAVLTLVSEAHGEGLGSVRDIAKEKGDLLQALPVDGVAVVNADDELAHAELLRSPARTWVSYGEKENASVRLLGRASRTFTESELSLSYREGGGDARVQATIPLLGSAGAYASLAAASVALHLHRVVGGRVPTPDELARGLTKLELGESGRLRPLDWEDGTVVLNDAYNANPASMKASIAAAADLARSTKRRLVLVLGEMKELGPHAESLHREIGESIASSEAALVIAVSGLAKAYLSPLPASFAGEREFVGNTSQAREKLSAKRRPGDLILLKGSNSIGLEDLASLPA